MNPAPEAAPTNWLPDRTFWQSQLGRAFLKYETKLGIATRAPEGKEANEAWQICHDERHKFLAAVAQQNKALSVKDDYIRQIEQELRAARDMAEINRQAWKSEEAYADALAREIADIKNAKDGR